ncbi:hypothetical protein QYF61_005865 [Mycteria americana]|uniref:ACB domain-containing protein n=1 Tax=Mycteria americana TaxID=33587 RepID=A0AAN7RT75_MYCAM|nr:hypothetical protein QYF61_005865 [Mycteria americana]
MASPPLAAAVVAAAAGSGGETSSGSEETGTAPPGRDLAALFEQAAERLPALLPAASKEQLLYLYARYKQVRRDRGGPARPTAWAPARRGQRLAAGGAWGPGEGAGRGPGREAWNALGDTSPHQAMQEYVAAVKKLDPSWNPQVGNMKILFRKQISICVFVKLTMVQLHRDFNCCVANLIFEQIKV